MKLSFVGFDLDGTLVNTLEDLHYATNYALSQQGLPQITLEQTRQFVGNGVVLLLKRASGSDDALRLIPPKVMSLEQCLEFINDDELVEVTPHHLRIRKAILDNVQRAKQRAKK